MLVLSYYGFQLNFILHITFFSVFYGKIWIIILHLFHFRLHLLEHRSGFHPTILHHQKQQPTFRQPTTKPSRGNAMQEQEIVNPPVARLPNKEGKIVENVRSFPPDSSQSRSKLHQKISLPDLQSSEHYRQMEPYSLWSANKTLLHAIRLQVINGKKIK